MTTGMTRLRPKLTDEDRRRCARLLTAFLVGDSGLVEQVFSETDQAEDEDAAVVGLVMAMADHACWVLENTTPLLPTEEDDPRDADQN